MKRRIPEHKLTIWARGFVMWTVALNRVQNIEVNKSKLSNHVDIWRPPGLHAIELHRGTNVTQEYPRHWHDELYLCTIFKGFSYLNYRGTSISTPRGTLAIVPSAEVHANRKNGCNFRCMFIDPRALLTAMEQFVERSIPGLEFRPKLVDDAQAIARFLYSHRSLEIPNSVLGQENSLFDFLYEFAVRHGTAIIPSERCGNEDGAVRRTKEFLDEHYAEQVRLRDLAKLTGLSPYHLNRSFCRQFGMPPHAYQLQRRIAHAKRFLQQGRSALETAYLAGFFDQSHFTHHFKRSVGVTPSQYLRDRKNIQD